MHIFDCHERFKLRMLPEFITLNKQMKRGKGLGSYLIKHLPPGWIKKVANMHDPKIVDIWHDALTKYS